jgi:hypothetical protein
VLGISIPLALGRFKRLPQRTVEVWQGGIVRFPMWVDNQTDPDGPLFPVIIRLLLTGALAITTAVGAAAQDVRPGYYTVGSFSGSSMGDDAAIWEARLQGIGAVYVGGLNPAVELVVRQKASDAAPVVAYLGTVEQGGGHRPRHERVQRQPRSEGGAPHTGMGAST